MASIVATVVAALFGLARLSVIEPSDATGHNVFVSTYDPPRSKIQAMIDVADGQAYAALAQDPTASRPGPFRDGPAEFVYRAQRPVYGWLIWAGSFGQPAWVPAAQFAVTSLSVGALAASAVLLAARFGRVRRWAPFVALLPGSALSIVLLIPEPLSVAFAVMGVVWWTGREPRRGWAVAAFVLAVLSREWLIIVPATLALHDLVIERRAFRTILPLSVVPAVLAGWVISLRVRHGAWPTQASSSERLAVPLAGWIRALPHLSGAVAASYVVAAVLLFVGLRRTPRSLLVWIAAAFAASTLVLGESVLSTESYRPLLAMFVFAFIAVLPFERGRATGSLA